MLDLKAVKVYEGDDTSDVTLKLTDTTMVSICTGVLDSMEALNKNLIDVTGNLELIFALQPFIASL